MDSLKAVAPKGLGKLNKIPRLRTIARIPQGPRFLKTPVEYVGGPGKPPPGFVVGQTSASEWNLYWAYAKVFDEPKDPRQPPFMGGYPYWGYQVSYMGAYRRAPGSAVVDYVIYVGGSRIGIRLQTLRFHYVTDAAKHAYDSVQKYDLEKYAQIIDVEETDVLGDPTGQKYIIAAKKSIGLIERIDPIIGGIDPRQKFNQ